MDFELTEEQRILKKSVHDFAKKECPSDYAAKLDEEGEFPFELWNKISELGLLGLAVPEKYGGSEGKMIDLVIVVEELSWGEMAPIASAYVMATVSGETLFRFGNEKQKRDLLPRLAKGKIIFSLGMTEPNAGSDIGLISTAAIEDGEQYVINGSKTFTSGFHMSDYILLLARTDNSAAKHKGLSLILLDTKSPGITFNPLKQLGGMAYHANEVFFDDVRTSKDNLIGEVNKGFYQILQYMDVDRTLDASRAVGHAQKTYEYALDYSKKRVQFGQPIGKFQAISHMIVDMATDISAARLLVYHAAWLKDSGKECTKEASMAKLYASEVARRASINGVQIMGGYGFMMDYAMQRFLREALQFTIVGGSVQIQRNTIAREIGL